MTRYVNIYPKQLHAVMTHNLVLEGRLTLHLEQYGLMRPEIEAVLRVVRRDEEAPWHLEIRPIDGVETPYFMGFAAALDRYVFQDLKAGPKMQVDANELPSMHLFFDGVYFDLSGEEPVLYKVPAAPVKVSKLNALLRPKA